MIARITVLGFTLMAMIGAPTQAQAEDDFGRSGIYAGAGVGVGFESFDGSLDYETPVGFGLWGGYRLIPNLALEVELGYLNGFDLEGTHVKSNALVLTGNVKAYVLTGRFQPFAVAGVGMLNWRVQDSSAPSYNESVRSEADLAARFGAGIDVYLSQSFALQVKASYVLSTRDLDGSDYIDLTAGCQMRF